MHIKETDSDHKLPTDLIEGQGICHSSPSHDVCNIEYLLLKPKMMTYRIRSVAYPDITYPTNFYKN